MTSDKPSTRIGEKIKHFFLEVFSFISSPVFLKNFVAIFLLFAVVIFGVLFWLNKYTLHGKSISVPDFENMEITDAQVVAKERQVELIIVDSVFRQGKHPGVILSQNPKKNSKVKKGRTVYLTTTKYIADKVNLPKVFGATEEYRQYAKRLELMGMHPKIEKKVFDNRLEDGTILKVFYKSKDISNLIEKGYQVPVGATIGFIISANESKYVEMPDIQCLSEDEATFILQSSELEIGEVKRLPGTTATDAFVVQQEPYAGKSLVKGSKVTIHIGTKSAAGCD